MQRPVWLEGSDLGGEDQEQTVMGALRPRKDFSFSRVKCTVTGGFCTEVWHDLNFVFIRVVWVVLRIDDREAR